VLGGSRLRALPLPDVVLGGSRLRAPWEGNPSPQQHSLPDGAGERIAARRARTARARAHPPDAIANIDVQNPKK
jgi:hypothetical protein